MLNKITIKCDKCQHVFQLTKHSIKTKHVYVEGKELVVEYFKCEKCKEPYVILIDDKETLDIKSSYQKCIGDMNLLRYTYNISSKSKQQFNVIAKQYENLKEMYKVKADRLTAEYKEVILPML